MMSGSLLAAFVLFAFVTSVTPGPNNMMLLASGVNFGWRPTLPHMLGISIGFTAMVILVGLGLGQMFERFPITYEILKWAGAAYLLWLAWKLFNAGGTVGGANSGSKPMTFVQAAAFQWVNPKAWTMAVAAISTYSSPENFVASVLLVGILFGIVNLPGIAIWALGGVWLKRYMANEQIVRGFNIVMALLLVASIIPAFLPGGH